MGRPTDHASRMERALLALVHQEHAERLIAERALPAAPWTYTDDTAMALGIVQALDRFGTIEQDSLALAPNQETWRKVVLCAF